MPLVRLEVKNEFGHGDPELYRRRRRSTDATTEEEDSSKAVLDGVAVAGLVGILRQLGDLTEFAADIFHDLHEQVTATSARGRKMFTRVRHVEAAVPLLEKTIQGQRSHVHFAYVAGSDWHADLKTGQSQLLSTNFPRFMMDSYEECHDPPRLYLLDKFDTGGIGACLKRYSDPSYFKSVWAKSELEKAGKDKKQKKAQKLKRKRPGLKNEVQSAASSSRHGSSACFASLSIDEQIFSAETASVSDIRFKPELASRSTSFGSRTRLNYEEQVPDKDSTRLPDDLEYDRMSNSKLQMNHNGPSTPDVHEERNGNRTGDNFIHGTLRENNLCRPPFVGWIEKAEIVKPVSPETCDDTLVGYTQDAEPLDKSSEQSDEEHGTTAELGMSNQDKYDFRSVPLQVYRRNHLDEPASETENYMDACNTLDSETETDSECHTKRELRSQYKFKYRGMKCSTPIVQEMATRNSFFSGVKISAESLNSLNGEEYPNVPDLVATECSGNVMSLHTIGFTLDPDHSPCSEFSDNNVLNMSINSGFKVINGHKPPESGLCGPFIQQPELINMTTASLEPQGLAPVDDSSIPATKFWSNGSTLGLEPSKPVDFSLLNNKSKQNLSGVSNSKRDHSNSINTSNLQYSMMGTKSELVAAPDEIIPSNLNSVENIYRSPYTPSYFNCGDLSDHKFFARTDTTVQQINPPRSFQYFHDTKHDNVAVRRNSQNYLQSLPLSECDKVQDTLSKDINTHLNRPDDTVAKGAEVSVSGTAQPNEFAQNTIPVSASLSAFAQRILANGFERKASITDTDIFKPSKAVNKNNGSQQDTSLQSNQNERPNQIFSQTSHEQNIKENFEPRSSKNSISSCSHDSEHSSPPLEHMKIPFYPMNGSEISKLKLEFLNGTLHKSNEDVMFPSFQLLPGPTLPFQASGSESDDETLSRSCPYTSDDYLSPHSDSNSEIWEQGDKSDSKNLLYSDLHRISVGNASLSILEESKQKNQIGSAIGCGNFEAKSGFSYFRSPDAADLPGHESFISTSVEGQGECGSLPSGPEGFAMQSPNEQQPPLPPLPPMQWRMTKIPFAKDADQGSRIAEPVEDFNIIHVQRSISDGQLEEDIPKPPPLPETMVHTNYKMKSHQNPNGQMKHQPNDDREFDKAQKKSHHIQDKHDLQKLIGLQEAKVYGSNGPEGGEKEDFLYQIRNKTFNLRRTDPVKPSLVPQCTTNINVAAILEKANTIRQACAGSDDGSDDDSWSDG